MLAVGDGAYKNIEEACDATIKVVKETPNNKTASKYYDRSFPVYQQLYRSLKKDFQAIAALG